MALIFYLGELTRREKVRILMNLTVSKKSEITRGVQCQLEDPHNFMLFLQKSERWIARAILYHGLWNGMRTIPMLGTKSDILRKKVRLENL